MTDWLSQCVAVIPCHNEAARIGGVIAAVRQQLTAVIVVDDGSSDATTRFARLAGAEVVNLAKNSGKGAALQAGWRHARSRGCSWVLMMDGDGQHAAEDIPALVAAAQKMVRR